MTAYDRTVLVEVLVYHYRKDFRSCGCGWAELGRSWPEHVATVYEQSVVAHSSSSETPEQPVMPSAVSNNKSGNDPEAPS